ELYRAGVPAERASKSVPKSKEKSAPLSPQALRAGTLLFDAPNGNVVGVMLKDDHRNQVSVTDKDWNGRLRGPPGWVAYELSIDLGVTLVWVSRTGRRASRSEYAQHTR